MARHLNNPGKSFQTTSFYKYQSESSSSSFSSEDFLTQRAKPEFHLPEDSCSAKVMFPEFFLKTSTKSSYMNRDRLSSRVTRTASTDKSSCKPDEGIKMWFVKEYGLSTF